MDYLTTDTALTGIASAIRAKGSTSASLSYPLGFISAIDAIPQGGGGLDDEIITRTISGSYENSSITTVGNYAFCYCGSLTSVNFPTCISIGISAFFYCSSLTSVNFPTCISIESNAFCYCSSLTSVSFPVCETIGTYAFERCSALTSVYFPTCISIGNYAFCSCSSLTSVNFPTCKSIGNYVFGYCSSLTSVNFPACTSIGSYVFYRCPSLTTIYLAASSVVSLQHSNAFLSTKITTTTGSIFVPASLVGTYKTATNWSYFSNRIFSIV